MSVKDQHFIAATLVRVIETEDGGGVLLDLQAEQFWGVDQMGMLMWTLFAAGKTPQEVMNLIAERYTIESEELLQGDVFQFLQQMEAQRLLFPVQSPILAKNVFSHQITWPSLVYGSACALAILARMRFMFPVCEWLEAWLLLRWVHRSLLNRKLIELSWRLHMLSTDRSITYANPDVRRLAARVHSAAAWQPFKAVCLHQNLVLGFMLRQRALEANLVIGVSTFPFFPHAWLRSGSEVINWEAGLGPGATLQRLHELSIIFCTEWFSDKNVRNGGMS